MVWHWFRHRLWRGPAESGKNTKMMTNFKVYILKSLNFDRYYVGHSADAEKRLSEHNTGRVRSTKAYKPWKIVYFELKSSKKEAYAREMQIKSYKHGEAFKKLIKGDVAEWLKAPVSKTGIGATRS
jgi:putative endonuclease